MPCAVSVAMCHASLYEQDIMRSPSDTLSASLTSRAGRMATLPSGHAIGAWNTLRGRLSQLSIWYGRWITSHPPLDMSCGLFPCNDCLDVLDCLIFRFVDGPRCQYYTRGDRETPAGGYESRTSPPCGGFLFCVAKDELC